MNTDSPESIQVNIFYQTYRLRSDGGGEHVRQVAQLVDERMRMIASQLATHDVAKIAVLAALNIADEMQLLKERYENELQESLTPPSTDEAESNDAGAASETSHGGVDEKRSWFDDIFGSDEMPKREGARLGSQITAKLQMLRQTEREALTIETDEER
ncbi:MAG: cell division protein ZapA [Pyrinomonadaceae bacterium]